MEQKKHEAENMPIGLMMSLAMHGDAMHEFSLLNDEQQKSVISLRMRKQGKMQRTALKRPYSTWKTVTQSHIFNVFSPFSGKFCNTTKPAP